MNDFLPTWTLFYPVIFFEPHNFSEHFEQLLTSHNLIKKGHFFKIRTFLNHEHFFSNIMNILTFFEPHEHFFRTLGTSLTLHDFIKKPILLNLNIFNA